MMKNKSNKEETYIEPRMVSKWWETKWREKKLIFNLGCSPIDEKQNELTFTYIRTYDGVPMTGKQNKQRINLYRT